MLLIMKFGLARAKFQKALMALAKGCCCPWGSNQVILNLETKIEGLHHCY